MSVVSRPVPTDIASLPDVKLNYWLFPLRDDWEWESNYRDNVVIEPNRSHPMMDKAGAGWLVFIGAESDSLDITFDIELITHHRPFKFVLTPRLIAGWGAVQPLPIGPFLTLYQETQDKKSVILMTPATWIPVRGRVKIYAINNTTGNITLTYNVVVLWLRLGEALHE